MTHQPPRPVPACADAGRQLMQLAQVRELVGQIAGRSAERSDETLDLAARISAAYADAAPIVQRRFDALAAETAAWAGAGVAALIGVQGLPPAAAAARLFEELETAQREMATALGL